jgi:hydrogenase expression/formation protein HypE
MKLTPYTVRAVLFDFDGTLTQPGALDFVEIRRTLGCPPDQAILEFIDRLPGALARQTAHERLEAFERAGADRSVPNPGAEWIIDHIRQQGLKIGIITRNGIDQVKRAFTRFSTINMDHFDLILTRDDPVRPKPDPAGILLAARQWHLAPEDILVVGDYVFDIDAGNQAGAYTVYLKNPGVTQQITPDSDATITSLEELAPIIRLGRPLPAGKFPNDLLAGFLDDVSSDPSVVLPPGVGQDTAAVTHHGSDDLLVLKSDPITFVSDQIGYYTVLINANDLATAGARPRWLLTTLLFPLKTTPSMVLAVLYDIQSHCRMRGISLCGGHTEITDAVTRAVVSATLIGTVRKADLIDKKRIQKGDRVLLTKRIAIEGTAIMAAEFPDRLKKVGVSETEIAEAVALGSLISILEEAAIAQTYGSDVSALHDVTEGGLATALDELTVAGGHRMEIDLDRVPIHPLTRKICRALGMDPLGLIGSGSLIICCRSSVADNLAAEIRAAGIEAVCIGTVLECGHGIVARKNGRPAHWPHFQSDELTRLYGG